MKSYNGVKKDGFEDGYTDGKRDLKVNKTKKFKEIDELEILSKIYDANYIKGYKKAQKIKN